MPSSQASIEIVSPGKTIPAKRAAKPATRVASPPRSSVGRPREARSRRSTARAGSAPGSPRLRRELRVGVQRVAVAAQPVEQRLLRRHGVRRRRHPARGRAASTGSTGRARRRSRPRRGRRSSDLTVHSGSPDGVVRVALLDDDRRLAFVPHVGDPGRERRRSRGRAAGRRPAISWEPCSTCGEVDVAARQVERRRLRSRGRSARPRRTTAAPEARRRRACSAGPRVDVSAGREPAPMRQVVEQHV